MRNYDVDYIASYAEDLFDAGFNWAEAVTGAVAEKTDLIPPGCAPRVGTPFGAGIGRLGDLCGSLTGALVAYGIACGRVSPDDLEGEEKTYDGARRIYEGFRERFGSVECRKLTGLDFDDPASVEKYEVEDMHNRICIPLVRGAVELLVTEFTDKP